MRLLAPLESFFLSDVGRAFRYLVDEFGFREEGSTTDAYGVTLRYRGPAIAVDHYFEDDRTYVMWLIPLVGGRVPPYVAEDMSEPFTRFTIKEFFAIRWPEGEPPILRSPLASSDLSRLLDWYANALRVHGAELLRGSITFVARVRESVRSAKAAQLLEEWHKFIERVERGFEGDIAEYRTGVNWRRQLADLLQPTEEPLPLIDRALEDLDRRYEKATAPLGLMALKVMPDPRAGRWWRMPKRLAGNLRIHFGERAD